MLMILRVVSDRSGAERQEGRCPAVAFLGFLPRISLTGSWQLQVCAGNVPALRSWHQPCVSARLLGHLTWQEGLAQTVGLVLPSLAHLC